MSTFAVFGMNEHFAREEAKKKVRDFKIKDGRRIELSMSQWLQAVEDRVIKVMDGKRVVQLSSMFDAPQFAVDYAELIRRGGASTGREDPDKDQAAAERCETEVGHQDFLDRLLAGINGGRLIRPHLLR